MKDRRRFLKVKIKSLAAEAKIIKLEEGRCKSGSPLQQGLHQHRVLDVRREQRASLLAYGFIRGRSLRQMEVSSKEPPDWDKVQRMIVKYGPQTTDPAFLQRLFKAWCQSIVPV